MKRISNVDTLSALFDRLITEHIKLFFFQKDKLDDRVAHQKVVTAEIRGRLSALFTEVLSGAGYDYIGEKRTFKEDTIVEELEELILNDINIGEADRARLLAVTGPEVNVPKLVVNEKRLRKANEGRARNKNTIDAALAERIK
jgi:hypothetical protein